VGQHADAFAEQRDRTAENVDGYLEVGIDGIIVRLPEDSDGCGDVAELASVLGDILG
jgi:hypothetical protein